MSLVYSEMEDSCYNLDNVKIELPDGYVTDDPQDIDKEKIKESADPLLAAAHVGSDGDLLSQNYTFDDDCLSFSGELNIKEEKSEEMPPPEVLSENGEPITTWLVPVIKKLEDDNECHRGLNIARFQDFLKIYNPTYPDTQPKAGHKIECERIITAHSGKSGINKKIDYGKITTKANEKYICIKCSKEYKFKSRLVCHMFKHSNKQKYPCGYCKKSFKHKSSLQTHLYKTCNIGKQQRYASGSKQIQDRIFICDHCGKSYNKKADLKIHFETLTKRHYCDVCGKGLASKLSLAEHYQIYHSASRRFKCEECGKLMATSTQLLKHVNRIHRPQNTPPECDVCLKKFTSEYSLRLNYFRYHQDNTFTCNDCAAVFRNKNALMGHIKIKHLPPTHKCSLCSQILPYKLALDSHQRSSHNIDNRVNSRFQCTVCGKFFFSKKRLTNHERTHTNEKPFVCETCGKCFRTDSNLYQHSLTHSEVRRFKCEVCEKAFRIKHHLRQHMASHGMATVPQYGKRGKKSVLRSD